MGCIPSKKQASSDTPLLKGSTSTESKKKHAAKPTLHRQNTLNRIDMGGSYDNMGNYKYKRWCGVRRSTCLLTLYIVFYAVFILFGAIVMMALEEENLRQLKQQATHLKSDFAATNAVNETKLEEFITEVLQFKGAGVSILDKDLEKKEWIFGEGILFSVTLLTTIGKN